MAQVFFQSIYSERLSVFSYDFLHILWRWSCFKATLPISAFWHWVSFTYSIQSQTREDFSFFRSSGLCFLSLTALFESLIFPFCAFSSYSPVTDLEFAIDIECLRQPCLHPANLVFQVDTHLAPRHFHFPFCLIVIATHYVFRPGASVHGSKQCLLNYVEEKNTYKTKVQPPRMLSSSVKSPLSHFHVARVVSGVISSPPAGGSWTLFRDLPASSYSRGCYFLF